MKSVSQTSGHNHGKRVKIVMRVKLYSQSECSPRWRLFLFVFHVLHRKVSPEHRSGAASPYRPPSTGYTSSFFQWKPHGSVRPRRQTDRRLSTAFLLWTAYVLRKLRTVYVFCCNTKSCPFLPCFPPPAPRAQLSLLRDAARKTSTDEFSLRLPHHGAH